MAWVRCCGGTKSNRPLSTLQSLGQSFTRWVKDSYYKSVAIGGSINNNAGTWNSASGDTVNLTTSGGYVPGIVTKCEANKTYNLNVTFSGIPASENKNVGVLFFGSNGTYINQVYEYGLANTYNVTFAVPSTATYTVLVLRRTENGSYNVTINGFSEVV